MCKEFKFGIRIRGLNSGLEFGLRAVKVRVRTRARARARVRVSARASARARARARVGVRMRTGAIMGGSVRG